MSDFLIHLARRSAGLSPMVHVRPAMIPLTPRVAASHAQRTKELMPAASRNLDVVALPALPRGDAAPSIAKAYSDLGGGGQRFACFRCIERIWNGADTQVRPYGVSV